MYLATLRLSSHYQHPGNWTPEAFQTIDAHANYLDALGREGRLLLAGRTLFDPGHEDLLGIAILLVETLEEAEAIRDADPAKVAGIQEWRIFPFSMGIRHLENLT